MASVTEACCTIPPIIAEDYKVKGEYQTLDVTGPNTATHAILVLYDIFGFAPQTLQGADILATSDKHRKYRVFIPDFFDGEPANPSWFSGSQEGQQMIAKFFQTKAAPTLTLERIPAVIHVANKLGSFHSWAILGYCWGGKVANLSLGQGTTFQAAVQAHPAMLDPEDAKNVTVPMALLASKDEDTTAVRAYESNLSVPKLIEAYPTQIHGWMAARANLQDPENVKEYERGYRSVLAFFHQHLN